MKLKKDRIKIIVRVFFIVLFLLVSFRFVDAGSNDSKLSKNRVKDVYAVTFYDNMYHLFYLDMYEFDGVTSYCIELGVDIVNNVYNSTYDFSGSKLLKAQIRYIKNLMYFGYGYEGHDNYRYYMATQELIWEYIKGVEIEWTNEEKYKGERIDIEEYKNDILELVNGYNGLGFVGYNNNMEVNIGDTVIINDKYDGVKYYEGFGEHSDVNIDGDVVYINFDTDYVGQETVIFERRGFYGYEGMLYYQGDSKKFMSVGDISEVKKLTFNVKGKNINVKLSDDIKNNGQYDYSGILFELYNNSGELLDSKTSDSSGNIVFENLIYGDYYIKGISGNDAYFLDEDKYFFEFNKGVDDIEIKVNPVINRLEILKLYNDEGIFEVEEGALFDVYNKDGSFYDSIITSCDGVGFVDLPYGEYIVKQRSGKNGYYMVDDFYVVVDKNSENVMKYTLVGDRIETALVINSINNGNNILEDGIFYKVRDDNNNYLMYEGNDMFQSIDGQVILPIKLGYGKYVVEVINNSRNFREVVKSFELNIDSNSDFSIIDGNLFIEIIFFYEEVKGSVEISSYREFFNISDNYYGYEYVLDKNAYFSIVSLDDVVVNNEVIYKSGDIVIEEITDNDGRYFIGDIYLGSYYLVDLYGSKIYFEIVDDRVIYISYNKELDKGDVLINNLSSELEIVEGSMFEVYSKDNLIYSGISNDDGVVKINDLVYGEYCVIQRRVGNGYLLNKDKLCFELKDDRLEMEFINKSDKSKYIKVPNTFSDKKSIKKLIGLCILLMGGSLYKIRKNNNS